MSLVYSYGSIYKSNLLFLSRGQVKSKYAGTGRQVVLKQPWRYVVWVQVPLFVSQLDGIASSMVEYYTSDIAILVRFQCNAINVNDHRGTQVLRTTHWLIKQDLGSTQIGPTRHNSIDGNEYSTAVSITTFQVVDVGSIPTTRIYLKWPEFLSTKFCLMMLLGMN